MLTSQHFNSSSQISSFPSISIYNCIPILGELLNSTQKTQGLCHRLIQNYKILKFKEQGNSTRLEPQKLKDLAKNVKIIWINILEWNSSSVVAARWPIRPRQSYGSHFSSPLHLGHIVIIIFQISNCQIQITASKVELHCQNCRAILNSSYNSQ